MNLKRFIVTGSAVALMLGSAVPAFAGDVAIIKNNDTTAMANSGGNTQDNYGGNTAAAGKGSGNSATVDSSGSRTMTTGNASAKAKSKIVANVNVGCGCEDEENGGPHSLGGGHRRGDLAVVKRNDTTAMANSGDNTQDNLQSNTAKAGKGHGNTALVDESGSRTMTTGNARAKAKSLIVVNSNINFGD